ncbi:MAG: hypothetical protein CMM07_21810 [Rhodopirellula sp.]|nr:hypothetical protein [Rhodopirellula sp.]
MLNTRSPPILMSNGLVASHTMPDLLTPFLAQGLLLSVLPILVCAILGSLLGRTTFRWTQVGSLFLGMLSGVLVVLLFALAALVALSNIRGINPAIGLYLPLAVGATTASWVSYKVSRRGRPKPPKPTLEMLNESWNTIEGIVRDRMRGAGIEIGASFDLDVVRNARILTSKELDLIDELAKTRHCLMTARALIHDDIAMGLAKSEDLLACLNTVES